jgi:hypothetical protein
MESTDGSGQIQFEVRKDDITTIIADVIALKFAQRLYGADKAVASALKCDAEKMMQILPTIGSHTLLLSQGHLGAKHALFLSVLPLHSFGYAEIRQFAADLLRILKEDAPLTRHLAVTIHGVGYGLDADEALRSEIAGFLDALEGGQRPPNLERVTIVDRDPALVRRLQAVLKEALPQGRVGDPTKSTYELRGFERSPSVTHVGHESALKPYIYIVMPSAEYQVDDYLLGVEDPARQNGFLCERANLPVLQTTSPVEDEATVKRTELYKLLVKHFNEEELKTLCFSLDVDYSNLGGEGTAGKARELVLFMQSRRRILELMKEIGNQRSDVRWNDMLRSMSSEQVAIEQIMSRIETAAAVIIELTSLNPILFLMLGYAWGRGRPTILITRDEKNIPAELRSQQCIIYQRIVDLRQELGNQLSAQLS